MKYIKVFNFLFLIIPVLGWSQVPIDSTYSYKELNEILSEARQGSMFTSKQDFAAVYYLLGKYEDENFNNSGQAFEYYTRSKEYYDILGGTAGMYQESIELYENALKYFTEKENLRQITYIHNALSKVYKEKGDAEKGLKYLNQAIRLNKDLKDSSLLVEFLINKVKMYEQLTELDSALLVSFEAFRVSNKIDDRPRISESLYHIGFLNKTKSDYDKAIKYLEKSEQFASGKPYSEQRKKIYEQLAICYSNIDDYKRAFDYNQKYAELSDSILNKERTESIDDLTIKYESEEKNTKMKILEIDKATAEEENEQQKRALYFLAGGLILMLALLYYIINFYRQKERADTIISQQKEEINQQKIRELEDNIQISSMQSMLEGQEIERERIAKDLHDSLGGLLSTIKLQVDSVKTKVEPVKELSEYKSANKMLDTAVAEVRSISQNLQPGALVKLGLIAALKDLFNRFDEEHYPDIDFQFYNLPERIDTMVSLSIYRIIQELLHNTIKHAKATEILIQLNREEDELVIQFEDDGKGFDLTNLQRKGMGLENIKSRVNYLKGEISFDAKEGEGTSVLIQHIKYK